MSVFQDICVILREQVLKGGKKFIIYPFGEYGSLTKWILVNHFGIDNIVCVDNEFSKYNENIYSDDIFNDFDKDIYKEFILLFACQNKEVRKILSKRIRNIDMDRVVDIFAQKIEEPLTIIGKYSYGSLCKPDWMVEEIGNFCSIAEDVHVVANHPVSYISTHPMMYYGVIPGDNKYEDNVEKDWFFSGVQPKGEGYKLKRTIIGNDVWIGRDVIITNGARIGNGVIAAAGAVITKDVPDYAIVAGVPARIIRFRYTKEQIDALNKICWWDWDDELIRERHDDFYLEIDDFIKKYI